jgi:hypothetical protein
MGSFGMVVDVSAVTTEIVPSGLTSTRATVTPAAGFESAGNIALAEWTSLDSCNQLPGHRWLLTLDYRFVAVRNARRSAHHFLKITCASIVSRASSAADIQLVGGC